MKGIETDSDHERKNDGTQEGPQDSIGNDGPDCQQDEQDSCIRASAIHVFDPRVLRAQIFKTVRQSMLPDLYWTKLYSN